MNYNEFSPSEALAPYIRCYWNLEDQDATLPHQRERIFPDGCIELIFHYGDFFRKFGPGDSGVVQPRSFIHGQLKKYIEIQATGRIGVFSARFQPGGLQAFIDFDVSKLTDITMSLEDIWGKQGLEIERQILEAEHEEKRIGIVEQFLLSRLREPRKEYETIKRCVDLIMARHGNINIEELTEASGINKRQLERRFTSWVGLSPKFLSRIMRFNHVMQMIENKTFDNLTSVAFEGGFYDQAHFIKDFKEFTGLNPKQYFSENLEMAKFFNLD